MTRGLEPTHDLFSSPGMAVGRFDPVIKPLVGPVIGAAAIRAECNIVAAEFVGHHDARLTPSAHQLAEKPPGSSGIPPFLTQNVQHITAVIDGAPKRVRLTVDGNDHLFDMPLMAFRRSITTDLRGHLRPETIDPCSDRLAAYRHTAFSEQILNVPQGSGSTGNSSRPHTRSPIGESGTPSKAMSRSGPSSKIATDTRSPRQPDNATTTPAKKGGDNIGISWHKKVKGDKLVAFCDRHCNVIAPFVSAPGNRNESPMLREALPVVMRIAKFVGINPPGSTVSLDGVYDCRRNRKAIFNRGMVPNISANPRGRKTTKRGRRLLFDVTIFKERFNTFEWVFGWEDKFRRLLLRFERISQLHYAFKALAYTMINLRHFCQT